MNENNELAIKVELKGGKEVIVRQGKAPDVEVPTQLKYNGRIDCPGDFYADRNMRKLVDHNCGHVTVDNRKLEIVLILDEKHSKRTEITGVLAKNPDLEAFGIWNKIFDHDELVKFIRKNKRFFASKPEFDKLLKDLSAFKYERNVAGKVSNDLKGNIEDNFKQTLKQNISLEFKLSISLFEGFPEKSFRVEIIPDITDGSIKFWFESVELIELTEREAKAIFEKEIKRFTSILVMYKN